MRVPKEERWKLRLQDARRDISSLLTETIYAPQTLEALLSQHREEWRFPRTLHSEFFLDYLVRTRLLQKHIFTRVGEKELVSYPEEITLFAKPDASDFDIALGMRSRSHLSHLSAAYLHGLTDLVPRIVYTNREQTPKGNRSTTGGVLKQEAVDRAFSKPERATGYAYTDERVQVVLLNGMFTNRLDVYDAPFGENGRLYPSTSLERTLIDCVVRPNHAGGIHEVLSMYEAARERVSVRRLRKVLDDLAYTYPYRQAIGFMLERAGVDSKQLRAFEHPSFEIDFYLDYEMSETEYSSRWRLKYPKGF